MIRQLNGGDLSISYIFATLLIANWNTQMKEKLTKLAKNIIKLSSLVLLFVLSASGVFLLLFNITFSEKIYPRISIAGNDIGNLSPKIAQKSIENQIIAWQDKKIQITYSDPSDTSLSENWQVEPVALGITPNTPKNILSAYSIGRAGNILKIIRQITMTAAEGDNLPVSYDLDENKFNNYIENNFSFLEKPGKDASLAFINGDLKEIPAQTGYAIDRDDLKQKITAIVQNLKNGPIAIRMSASSPKITDDKIKKAQSQAINLTTRKISLQFEKKTWLLEKKTIGSFLNFISIDDPENEDQKILGMEIAPDLVNNYLEKIQMEINRKPSNAVFGIKDDRIIIETGGEIGAALSLDKSTKKIIDEMQKGVANNIQNIAIDLLIEKKEPAISKKTLKNMEINSLIGQGTSNFSGSPANRRLNIAAGTAKFNNIFIAPNEEFSFVTTLGEISAKTGYLPELVIKEDKVIAELGGGLCQVSTTAFRAAIYAGLPILERRPHAYAVPYYSPQGMDATIYPPHPDLQFKNDTGAPILVQTKIIKNELVFNFFGKKQERAIKIIGPDIYEKNSDGSMKTVFWREFYEGDVLQKKEPFYSSYASPNNFPHKNPLE
ncbi:VanW family protein [Patescibacteria group bacterium]|nr:VanW family protein [Patescibacteria group bacterium]MBU4579490.1 VanW family protein [Patescibacteria group bacterium]